MKDRGWLLIPAISLALAIGGCGAGGDSGGTSDATEEEDPRETLSGGAMALYYQQNTQIKFVPSDNLAAEPSVAVDLGADAPTNPYSAVLTGYGRTEMDNSGDIAVIEAYDPAGLFYWSDDGTFKRLSAALVEDSAGDWGAPEPVRVSAASPDTMCGFITRTDSSVPLAAFIYTTAGDDGDCSASTDNERFLVHTEMASDEPAIALGGSLDLLYSWDGELGGAFYRDVTANPARLMYQPLGSGTGGAVEVATNASAVAEVGTEVLVLAQGKAYTYDPANDVLTDPGIDLDPNSTGIVVEDYENSTANPYLAYRRVGTGQVRIAALDLDAGTETLLGTAAYDGNRWNRRLTLNGDHIVYAHDEGIYSYRLDGSGGQALAEEGSSPVGKGVDFVDLNAYGWVVYNHGTTAHAVRPDGSSLYSRTASLWLGGLTDRDAPASIYDWDNQPMLMMTNAAADTTLYYATDGAVMTVDLDTDDPEPVKLADFPSHLYFANFTLTRAPGLGRAWDEDGDDVLLAVDIGEERQMVQVEDVTDSYSPWKIWMF